MGDAGKRVVSAVLPDIKKEQRIDFVIAQAENIANGKSPTPTDIQEMQKIGVDFFTGGNHSFSNKETEPLHSNPSIPLTRPANAETNDGYGSKLVRAAGQEAFVASILGQTVGAQRVKTTNPLHKIDELLEELSPSIKIRIVNFHGDFSSEKRVFGYYLDGRVSAVIGDHWHVPTADAMILPKGTAHITDVGMCGSLHSSLGVKTSTIVDRWKTGNSSKNELEDKGPYQFNAVIIDVDESTGLSRSIEHIQRVIE
jgi:metallophosphoesterase (TIGR00282 family)